MLLFFVFMFAVTLAASIAEAVVEKDLPRDIGPFCLIFAALLGFWVCIVP